MNFITKLSKSKNSTTQEKYDLVLVMMNKLIKYFYIIVYKKSYFAK